VVELAWFALQLGFISVLLTAMLQFFVSYTMAMLAFWVMEVSTFIFILYAFEYIASGHMFPLAIMPPVVQDVLSYTPFPYQLYLPVGIYLGKITGVALIKGLLAQAGWVVAAFLMARLAWFRGIKKYAAAGG
jgi:ABC-2 type transport system permease protein